MIAAYVKRILRIINCLIRWILLSLVSIVIVWLVMQTVVFASFKIPTDSMEPTLTAGDHIIVNKLTMGARIFNLSAAFDHERFDIYRLPALGKIHRNDILVFNFPYGKEGGKIDFDVMQYYIKRCIALPGDSIEIRDYSYKVSGYDGKLGNTDAQEQLKSYLSSVNQEEKERFAYWTYPWNGLFGWNVENFGPLYLPQKGDVMVMNEANFILYKQLIEWEQRQDLKWEDHKAFLGDKRITSYCFLSNYYFVAGDNVMNSKDSRYWGLLPEDFVVGKASFIWKSEDLQSGKYRWERFLKSLKYDN